MSSSAVDADLANFASGVRGHIRFASSCPKVLASAVKYVPLPGHVRTGSVVALGQLYRAVASAMLGHLNVRGPFLAAQVGIGSQPRKAVFTTVPEFKRFVHVSLPSLPELTVKGRLKAPLTVQDTVLPAGSKLLPPLAFRAADCVGGRCDISSRVHLSDSHSSDQLDATDDTGVLRSAPPLCGSPSAPPPLLGLGGAALGLGGCLANDYGASQSQCSGDAPGNSPGADEASPDCAKCTVPSKSLQPCVTDSEADLLALGREEGVTESELVQIFDALPAETPARMVDDARAAREKAWSAGAFSQGTLCGLRKNTRSFPHVVRAAVGLLRAKFPHATLICNDCHLLQCVHPCIGMPATWKALRTTLPR